MGGISKEAQLSIAASSMFPGFRFSPTDEELISYYLKNKLESPEKSVEVISEVDICNFEPWDLPGLFFPFLFFMSQFCFGLFDLFGNWVFVSVIIVIDFL